MSEPANTPRPVGFYPAPPLPEPVKPIPKWVLVAAVPLILLGIAAASVGGVLLYRHGNRSALETVAPLHAQMAAGDDAGIFAASDPRYQQQVGLEKSNQLFDLVRVQLGAPLSSQVEGFNLNTDAQLGESLTLTLRTTFAKGVGTETIKWRKDHDHYRLLGYHVKSTRIVESDVPKALRN